MKENKVGFLEMKGGLFCVVPSSRREDFHFVILRIRALGPL